MDMTVYPRPAQSKGARKRRLRQGFVPGSIYGRGIEPMLVEVPARAISAVLLTETGMNTMLNVSVHGSRGKHSVLVDNLERDPITRSYLNIGLHQVSKGDRVHAQIPVNLIGTPSDVALNGALLEQTLEHVDVTGEPADLPAHLDVDVSGLHIGDVLRVSDLAHSAKLTFTTPEDSAVASVHVSTTARQVEEDAATTAVSEDLPTGGEAVTELRADKDAGSDSITGAEGQP